MNIIELLEQRQLLSASFEAHIHFQTARSAVPTGYVADTGAVIAARSNGMSYGWNAPRAAHTVSRNAGKHPTNAQLLNHSFAIMNRKGRGSLWEIAVPDGTYSVTITAGDTVASGLQQIEANGIMVVNGKSTAKKHWIVGTQSIVVTDGLLKLTEPRAGSAKINAIDIVQQTPQGGGTPTGGGTTSQGTLDIQGNNVTLSSNSGGGVTTLIDGVRTDYAAGQWSAVHYTSGSDSQTFSVLATVVPTSISGAFDALNPIAVGDPAAGLQRITAPLTIDPGTLHPSISLSDSGDTVARNLTLSRGATSDTTLLHGIAPVDFSIAADAVTIVAGSGADTISVPSTGNGNITWNNTGGADQVTFGNGTLSNISASVLLQASGGTNSVVFNGSNDTTAFSMRTPADTTLAPTASRFDWAAADFTTSAGAAGIRYAITMQTSTTPSLTYTDSHDASASGAKITFDTNTINKSGQWPALVTLNGGPRDQIQLGTVGASTFNVTANVLGAEIVSDENSRVNFTGLDNSTTKARLSTGADDLAAGVATSGTSVLTYSNVNEIDIGSGTLALDYGASNTDPLPAVVKFNVTELDGLPTTGDPFAGHQIYFGNRTYIAYPAGQGAALQTLLKKYLALGYAGGTWAPAGNQFISSTLLNSNVVAGGLTIGYANQTDNVADFVTTNTIELYVTKVGDTDLNGHVTMPDLARLQAHLGQAGNWDDGDLNYDGIVDNTDLALLQKYLGT